MSDGEKDPLAEVAEEEEEVQDLDQQLFGSDDEGDDQIEEQVAAPSKEDRKAKLKELAARKEAERREAESGKTKRRRAALEDDDEDEGPGAASARAGEDDERAHRAPVDSEDDEEGEATAEDQGFIDDEGVETGNDIEEKLFGADSDEEDGDPADAPQAEEAIEDDMEDEFEMLQRKGKEGRGKRRREEDEEALKDTVEGFITRMEAAVEKDVVANSERKPAISKLKMCKEVSETLSQAHIQRQFLDAGGLTVLTHWLSPLNDGSLPNINIRSAILKVLLQMPIHVDDPERREQLKKSGLGKVVMFLYKLPEETRDNRKVAKELVERWSRPIFALDNKHQNPDDTPQRRLQEDRPRKANKKRPSDADQELDEDGNPMSRKGPAPGERGWRWHASIPQVSKLDYAVRPEPKFSKEDMAQKSDAKAKHDQLSRKMIGLKARNKRGSNLDRPSKMSVEGRGLMQ